VVLTSVFRQKSFALDLLMLKICPPPPAPPPDIFSHYENPYTNDDNDRQ
jgi:hypothetical protein